MRGLIRVSVFGVILIGRYGIAQAAAGEPAEELEKFFHEFVGLTDDQVRDVRGGKAIAKVLEPRTPDEVFVFGAVYINSAPERYLTIASDTDALRKLPSFIGLGKFSNPPQIADLDGFVLDEKDLDELKHCRPAHCEVQLPTEAIEKFQHSVDWTAPDSSAQANRLAQQMALAALLRAGHAIPSQHVASTLGDFHFACGRIKTVEVASVRTDSDREFASSMSIATAP